MLSIPVFIAYSYKHDAFVVIDAPIDIVITDTITLLDGSICVAKTDSFTMDEYPADCLHEKLCGEQGRIRIDQIREINGCKYARSEE